MAKPTNKYEFSFEPKALSKGKESLQEMSLLKGQYNDYVVTKTGYLVTVLSGTGINLDLLSDFEQTDVFDEYNAFLMGNVAESRGEIFQFLDMTVPVDFKPYVLGWKNRYLKAKEEQPENEVLSNLIASYILHYEDQDNNHEMNTQEHYVVLREKIKDKNYNSLQFAEKNLNEKAQVMIRALESQFEGYDLIINRLNGQESKKVLHLFMNFNQE